VRYVTLWPELTNQPYGSCQWLLCRHPPSRPPVTTARRAGNVFGHRTWCGSVRPSIGPQVCQVSPSERFDLLEVKTKMFVDGPSVARHIFEVERSVLKIKDANYANTHFLALTSLQTVEFRPKRANSGAGRVAGQACYVSRCTFSCFQFCSRDRLHASYLSSSSSSSSSS